MASIRRMESLSRRRLIQTSSTLSIFGLAGCASLPHTDSSTDQPREYDWLEATTIYVADDVGLRLPDDVTRVDAPKNAELVILHGNLAVSAEQVVTWLTEDRVIALLGDRAQESWLDVVQSDPYREAFDSEGYGVGEPAPHLLVGVAIDDRTTTYRKSWGDQPANDDILAALDETMSEIKSRSTEERE